MAQDTATQDNVTGTADVGVAAGLADPQYGYANLNTIFDIAIPDGDFYNLGTIAGGSSGTIHVGGALDEISVFVVQFLEDGSQVLAPGNGIDDQAIFTADPAATTWSLNFTAPETGTYFVVVVDQTEADGMTGVVSQSSPYVLTTDLAVAQAQSSSYQGGSMALTGTSGAEGSFTVNGSEGGETIDPDSGEGIVELLQLSGTDDPELIQGAELAEQIFGFAGNDILFGGAGGDVIYGNTGDDVVYGNLDNDILYGGRQIDVVYGGQHDDVLYGNLENDIVYGNAGNDTMFGGQGEDIMFGGQGNDNLRGNLGNDTLFGNLGADTLTGNAGSDSFVLSANQGADIVTDFDIAGGDRVLAFTSFTQSEVNGNVVLEATNGDGSLTLLGVDLASFESALPITLV
tara:strand:- start:1453 stop:2655 length:1203 start_codon:yes stop_codon:yes gene_type:complete